MVTPQGYLVPVVAALGNHDLIGHFDQTPAQAAIFSALFPMPEKNIYNVLDFNSYLSIFILDSGHANPIGGQQASWLRTALKHANVYHIAWLSIMYPLILPFANLITGRAKPSDVFGFPFLKAGGFKWPLNIMTMPTNAPILC